LGSLSAVVGIAAAALGVMAVLERNTWRKLRLPHVCWLAFVAWDAATVLWSWDQDATLQRAVTNVQILVMICTIWQLRPDHDKACSLASAYLVGVAIVAILTLWNYQSGEQWVSEERYAASGYDPNDMGVTLAIGIPLSSLLTSESFGYKGYKRILAGLYVPLALLAVFLTASRGATLATAVSLTAWFTRFKRAPVKWKVTGMAAAASLAALSAAVIPATSWARLLTLQEEAGGGSLGQRIPLWKAGLSLLPKHFLVGIGAGSYPVATEQLAGDRKVAHNTLLSISVESGGPGVMLFYLSWFVLCRRVWERSPEARWVVLIVAATWLVGTMSLTWEYRKTTWFVLALFCELAYPAWTPSRRRAVRYQPAHI
jgi:O-antigen ligase